MIALAFIATVLAGYLADSFLGFRWNWPDAGAIAAIATMGSFLLWAIRHPKRVESGENARECAGRSGEDGSN